MTLVPFISALQQPRDLTEHEAQSCLSEIFSGSISESQITSLLNAMADKGESVSEIVGFARAMRSHMVRIPFEGVAIDVCGTGGSGRDRFNISTAVAFILASLDVAVAKHGNYGSKKANGSFDFLQALKVPFGQTPEGLLKLLNEQKLCFILARNHHLAMKFVAASRKEVGRRTIFNLMGPLCNPVGVSHQLIGTASKVVAEKLSQAIFELGTTSTLVVSSEEGIDELSIHSLNHLYHVTPAGIQYSILDPKTLGLETPDQVYAGDLAEQNASFFLKLISGELVHFPTLNTLALNAGAALWILNKVSSIEAGVHQVKEALFSGKVRQFFDTYLSKNSI